MTYRSRPSVGSNKRTNTISEWLRLAAQPVVVKRATRTALIVGAILIAINHGSEILSGRVTPYSVLQICLTITVPYLVSTSSSVATLRSMMDESSDSRQQLTSTTLPPYAGPEGYISLRKARPGESVLEADRKQEAEEPRRG